MQAGKVFPGDGLTDLCHRRRIPLETCLKNQRNVTKNTVFRVVSVVELEKNVTS